MIKTVFIHIGLHKTASTSIQDSLAESHEYLINNNYLYPIFFLNDKRIVNHSIPFFSLFTKHPAKYQVNIKANINDDNELEKVHKKYLEQLKSQIDSFQGEYLIISGEDISRLTVLELLELRKLIIDLTNPNIKIEVIAFVRNPVDLVKSSMQEMVKHGEVIENIYSVTVERLKNKFRLTLDKFLQAFSSDEVKVFRMEDAQKHQNGICGYFMQIIGAPELIQNLVSLFYSNQSISYEAIMLLSAVNHSFPLFIDGKSNPERKDLDQFSLIKIPGEKYSISESKRKLIWDNCQEDLKWLYTTFGVNPYSYRYEGKITGTEYWGRKSLEYLDTIFADQPDKIREVLFKCVVKEINVHFEQKDLKEMIFTLKYFFRLSRKAKILLSPQYLFNCYVKWIFYFLISIFKMPFSFLNKPK